MQSALSKERRESKQQVQRDKDGSRPRGNALATGSRLLDPMAPNPTRSYEDEEPATWTNARNRDKDMPEWMKHITAGGKATFGKRTVLSIKEQRESLPIYSLKEALMQAIDDNQVGGRCKLTFCLCFAFSANHKSGIASDSRCYRRNGIRQDDANDAVSSRRRLCASRPHRLYAAASCGGDVRSEARERGIRVRLGSRSRIYNSI